MLTISKQEKRKLNKWDLLKYVINGKFYEMEIVSKEYKETIQQGFTKSYTQYKEYLIGKDPETGRKRKVELDTFRSMNDSCLTF